MEEKKKRATCKDRERKNKDLHLKMTNSQMNLLNEMCFENDETKTNMVLAALKFYNNFLKGKFSDSYD